MHLKSCAGSPVTSYASPGVSSTLSAQDTEGSGQSRRAFRASPRRPASGRASVYTLKDTPQWRSAGAERAGAGAAAERRRHIARLRRWSCAL